MDDPALQGLVERALAEDVGEGDLTANAVVPAQRAGQAIVTQKQAGVLYGFEVAAEVFRQAGAEGFEGLALEGQWHEEVPVAVARSRGPARSLLAAERTALNFLCHLSGIATLTARYVRAVEGSGARILDTRKTTPGLRRLEKAAVAAGGGQNHRLGLYDAILIKENHVAIAGSAGEAVRRALASQPERTVEIECRDLDEVGAALEAGAGRLLLDNMDPPQLRRAVELRDSSGESHGPVATLEASGGVTLDNVAEIAATGVEFVSVGALTHSAPALDLSMLVEPLAPG